jgi:Spy/CpxP family protein refolding chaperone
MKLLYVGAAFILACVALSALAQTSSTAKEVARLEKGQARVQKMESKAVADGKITKKERARIERAQDRQSKAIYRQKHDKQTAK